MQESKSLKLPQGTPEIWNESGDKQRKLKKNEKQKAMDNSDRPWKSGEKETEFMIEAYWIILVLFLSRGYR